MNILVTGAEGFVGRNLVANLEAIRDGKNQTRPNLAIDAVFACGSHTSSAQLDAFCQKADFVLHFAGVNRSENPEDFQKGNVDFTKTLLDALKRKRNPTPVLYASSVQASCAGRFGVTDYGLSKKGAENLLFEYGQETGAKVLVYRFPNLAGKWIRPNYNSAVATFCYNIARDLPVVINDPSTELELLFIDDLLEEIFNALEGNESRCNFDGVRAVPARDGKFCAAPVTHFVTLGEIVDLLRICRRQPHTLIMPRMVPGSFEKKLYSMYLSYLPKESVAVGLVTKSDKRGSFTEFLKTPDFGQISVNVIRPRETKGEHWHNGKWEIFYVVSGHGLIRMRRLYTDEILEFEVSGDNAQAVYMLPGYTHSITNLSDTENLTVLMWANEIFDPERPDTFSEAVGEGASQWTEKTKNDRLSGTTES